MKVRCLENRFALRFVGANRLGFVKTDTPLPNLVVGKVYDVGGAYGKFIHVYDETHEGAVWPTEHFEWVEGAPRPQPMSRVVQFRRR